MKRNNAAAKRQMAGIAILAVVATLGPVVAAQEDTNTENIAIGIDLGTTYSVVSVYENGKLQILTNPQGKRITPSYVAWNPETCERMIGDAAKNQLTTNPKNTVSLHYFKPYRIFAVQILNVLSIIVYKL